MFISATDEELDLVHDNEMDHVTYVLIMLRLVIEFHFPSKPLILMICLRSLAFTIYVFVLLLINMWGTTGRNSISATVAHPQGSQEDGLELDKWYQRVPVGETDADPLSPQFVIGEHDTERDP